MKACEESLVDELAGISSPSAGQIMQEGLLLKGIDPKKLARPYVTCQVLEGQPSLLMRRDQ